MRVNAATFTVRNASAFCVSALIVSLSVVPVPVSAQTDPIRTHFDGEWAGILVKVESQGDRGCLQFYRDRDASFIQVDAPGVELRQWAEAVEAMQAEVHRVGRNERVELSADLHRRTRDTGNVSVTRTITSRGSRYAIYASDEYIVNSVLIDASPARVRSLLRYVRAAAGPAPAASLTVPASPVDEARRPAPDTPARRDGAPTGTTSDRSAAGSGPASSDERFVERPERSPRSSGTQIAVYPDAARRAGVGARVRVRVLVNSAGQGVSVEVVERTLVDRRGREQTVASLPYGLEESALTAARNTAFYPARDGGANVRAYATLTVPIGIDP